MAEQKNFGEGFRALLKEIPGDFTLEQWQHAYEEAMFLMGMKILERFEKEAIAGSLHSSKDRRHTAAPSPPQQTAVFGGGYTINWSDSSNGGSGPGWSPSIFRTCRFFPDYPLSLQTIAVEKGPSKRKK